MPETLRLAELMAALSLATDLGMGQPLEQALRTCLIALALGERLDLGPTDLSTVYYVALLRFLGCTADAHEAARLVGGDDIAFRSAVAPVLGGPPQEFVSQVIPKVGADRGPLRRARIVVAMLAGGRQAAREGVRAHCEVAENLAQRLGLADAVRSGLGAALEQWNGEGLPNGIAGEAIPLSARIVFVARDVEILNRLGGSQHVLASLRTRRGAAYDPAVVDVALRHADELLAAAQATSPWEAVLESEPEPRPWVPESRLDTVLCAFADFVDLKSPFTAGHSRQVAELAAAASPSDAVVMRRAGLLHDLGRVAVPNGIWDKPGQLTEGERERVRLHPYYSERVLGRVKALAVLARVAGMHHERLDGSGYHRGTSGAEIPAPARVLAAADAYQAMTQVRPHRPAFPAERAVRELESMARSGLLDGKAVQAVVHADGHQARAARAAWPAGLSDREVEVLRLLCTGNTKAQVASQLFISPSTVDHHVRHIYGKTGVRSRAGATLFALEHGLLK